MEDDLRRRTSRVELILEDHESKKRRRRSRRNRRKGWKTDHRAEKQGKRIK